MPGRFDLDEFATYPHTWPRRLATSWKASVASQANEMDLELDRIARRAYENAGRDERWHLVVRHIDNARGIVRSFMTAKDRDATRG